MADLWTSSGTLLTTATFSNETASGWQQVNFSSPVAITAGTTYVASYHTNAGHYADDQNYFSSQYNSGQLHVPASGGVYAYGGAGSFPTQTWNASNYWVDVVFSTGPNTTPSAVTAQNPGNNATPPTVTAQNPGNSATTALVTETFTTAAPAAATDLAIAAPASATAGAPFSVTITAQNPSNDTAFGLQPEITNKSPLAKSRMRLRAVYS